MLKKNKKPKAPKAPKVDFNHEDKKKREEKRLQKEKEMFQKRKQKEQSKEKKKTISKERYNNPDRTNLIKYKNKNQNKVSILKNMLINNGDVTAYFILKPFNYSVSDAEATEDHITSLYNTIATMYSSLGSVEFSIFNINNIVSKREVIKDMIDTVKIYNDSYTDIDPEYRNLIESIREDFSILAVNIDISHHVDVEMQSVTEIINSKINSFFQANFSSKMQDVNENVLIQQDKKLIDILELGATPVNEKLVLNIYMNSLFPDYNIIYSNFILNHASDIIGGIKQDIIPHLGWFELSNLGVATLGFIPEKTYGSIINIIKFPDEIETKYFNLINMPGLTTNIKCRPKEKVELSFRRMRADTKAEYFDAAQIGDEDNESAKDWDEINEAIKAIRNGRVLADVDANILITADSKQELDSKRAQIISILADMGVLSGIAGNQAEVFMNSFVKRKPKSYFHIMDLEYALSFNQDHGVHVGDADADFYAPTIGESN